MHSWIKFLKGTGYKTGVYPPPTWKKFSLQIWMIWDYEKKKKFGVIYRPSTSLGCNNVTLFFFFLFETFPYQIWNLLYIHVVEVDVSKILQNKIKVLNVWWNGWMYKIP